MFGAQRVQKIKEILLEQGHVEVTTLSEILGVSEVTVRRDLDKLDKEGLLIKTYGGAILNIAHGGEKAYHEKPKENENYEQADKLIAKIASDMINNEESIFLGGGVISRNIAELLYSKSRLFVITNDIYVASTLNNNPNIRVTLTGGDLFTSSGLMVGPLVLRMLKDMYVNKAFIEVKGIHLDFGYTMDSYDEVEMVKELLKVAKEGIAIANCSKFGHGSVTRLGDLLMFKKVITNKEVPNNYKEYYYNHNMKLYTTYDIK